MYDDDVVNKDLAAGPADQLDEAALFWTCFEFPVRFAVNGIELYEVPAASRSPALRGEGWCTVPKIEDPRYANVALLGFATELCGIVASANDREVRSSWVHMGPLSFKRIEAGSMHIRSSLLGREAVATSDELRVASLAFLLRVKSFFLDRVPGIQRHKGWNKWFAVLDQQS